MDVETIQLLNLSPIPELSEVELSTMMEHLSGLSDINGDLTDQHVEDIIKEAEDLIDKSSSNKTNELSIKEVSEIEENKSLNGNQSMEELKGCGEYYLQELPLDDSKHYNTPNGSDHLVNDVCSGGDAEKHFSSPPEQTPIKIFSPGGSCNHIKSTIDSLKEFSTMIEKQLTSRSPNLSPKYSKIFNDNERDIQTREVSLLDSQMNEKHSNLRAVKIPDSVTKKNSVEPLDKSVKLLNCFERLYQNKPIRLSIGKKPKAIDKIPKTSAKKKLTKDLKTTLRNKQGKTVKKFLEEDIINTANENIYQNMGSSLPRTLNKTNLSNCHKTSSECCSLSNFKHFSHMKPTESQTNELFVQNSKNYSPGRDNQNNHSNLVLSKIDEKLILKVLEEVEQIKDQVKKAGFGDGQTLEKATTDDPGIIDSLKSEVESVREKVTSVSNAGIRRLQEQFSLLKLKYYQQMEKLEAENFKLREALRNQQKFYASRRNTAGNMSPPPEACFQTEPRHPRTSVTSSPSSCDADRKVTRNVSESCRVSSTDNNFPAVSKEAYCQTEKEVCNVSIQCTAEVAEGGKKEIVPETRKTENKENITLKHKLGRCRPFSDVSIHQLTRQKKLVEHESQLLATLRGLQSELTVKDKENKKLKAEVESLKKQIKKLANSKADYCKKSHIGTQTIGLGPCVQKVYTPEIYEVPKEFERENEDLKSRIKSLEEEFELLKEKRINDLQSLHQVHEEEMAKLISKLETQSSLTKHLHSLLLNR